MERAGFNHTKCNDKCAMGVLQHDARQALDSLFSEVKRSLVYEDEFGASGHG